MKVDQPARAAFDAVVQAASRLSSVPARSAPANDCTEVIGWAFYLAICPGKSTNPPWERPNPGVGRLLYRGWYIKRPTGPGSGKPGLGRLLPPRGVIKRPAPDRAAFNAAVRSGHARAPGRARPPAAFRAFPRGPLPAARGSRLSSARPPRSAGTSSV